MFTDKLIIKIVGDNIYYGNNFKISLDKTNFPNEDSKFKPRLELYWLTEITDYSKEKKAVELKIVDYNFRNVTKFLEQNPKTQLNHIKFTELRFKSIEQHLFCYKKCDFVGLAVDLESEETKSNSALELKLPLYKPMLPSYRHDPPISQKVSSEIVYINFNNIKFEDGIILIRLPFRFLQYLDYTEYALKSINSRKEFQSVHKYFKKHFGNKIEIQVNISNNNLKKRIIDVTANSLSYIDNDIISEIRYDVTLSEIKSKRNNSKNGLLLLSDFMKENESILKDYSPQEFIKSLLNKSPLIHSKELDYLTTLHTGTNKKNLEFVITPEFGFLFYIETDSKCNFIFETYKVDKATYIWSVAKNERDDSINSFYDIVIVEITQLLEVGRIPYRKSHTYKSFNIIEHSNIEEGGFENWKHNLMLKLVED